MFRDAPLSVLVEHHRAALAYLEGRGLPFKPVSAASFTADFKGAVAAQRAHFLARPIRWAVVAIWRSATKLTPHVAPLDKQPTGQRQIAALVTGRRG